METITLQGPVVVIPAIEYEKILSRLAQLEQTVEQLVQYLEDLDDIKAMREAEAEYHTGDKLPFSELLVEVRVEKEE